MYLYIHARGQLGKARGTGVRGASYGGCVCAERYPLTTVQNSVRFSVALGQSKCDTGLTIERVPDDSSW